MVSLASTALAFGLIAGCHRRPARHVSRPACRQYQSAPAYLPAPAPLATPQAVGPGESFSFAAWLNAERAARGLPPCGVDAGLCADAAENSRRGFGHSYMGRARRQNAGVGPLPTVCSMWVASPAHAAALFDPSITRIGLAQVGQVITFDAD